jgi:all-trans-retinol dehydrogenase (NAD+)
MASLIRKPISVALNPLVTGPLLYLLTRSPQRVQMAILVVLSSRLPASLPPVKLIKVLKVLFVLGLSSKIVSRVNERLNEWALNNWIWNAEKDKWVWNQEVAVVTGGCSGIGAEVVRGLISKGVKVAVLDIQQLPSDLERSKFFVPKVRLYVSETDYHELGTRVTLFHCDVTSPTSIAEASKQVRAALGDPSILVNNAGIGSPHPILETSNEWITKIFQINIISHFWLVKEFMPDMVKKNKGHIVGLASMASFVSPPGIVDYAATKSAVLAFHEGTLCCFSTETLHADRVRSHSRNQARVQNTRSKKLNHSSLLGQDAPRGWLRKPS